MSFIESSFGYFTVESPFVQYFDRCKLAGISRLEIKSKLFQLEKYYKEMVLDQLDFMDIQWYQKSLDNLFTKWSDANYVY